MRYEYPTTADGSRPLVEYDPEAEIVCLLEECQEAILQVIKRCVKREQFGPFLGVLMAVKEAQDVTRR